MAKAIAYFIVLVVPILIIVITKSAKKNRKEKAIQNISSYIVPELRKEIGSDLSKLSNIVLDRVSCVVKKTDGTIVQIMYNGYEIKWDYYATKKLMELAQAIISSYPLTGFKCYDRTTREDYAYSDATVSTVTQYNDTIKVETRPETVSIATYKVIIERDISEFITKTRKRSIQV